MSLRSVFSDIANAIRSKAGIQDTMTPAQMPDHILNISGGSGYDFDILENRAGTLVTSNYFYHYPKISPVKRSNPGFPNSQPVHICIGPNVTFINRASAPSQSNMWGIFGHQVDTNICIPNGGMYIDGFGGDGLKNIESIMAGTNFLDATDHNNQKIYLNDSIESAVDAFYNAQMMNAAVKIPNNLVNGQNMFAEAAMTLEDITIPRNLVDGSGMFSVRRGYSSLYMIRGLASNLTNAANMFYNCFLASPLQLIGITAIGIHFDDFYFGGSLVNAVNMFYNTNATGNVYISASETWMGLWQDYDMNGNYDAFEQLQQLSDNMLPKTVPASYYPDEDVFNCLRIVFDDYDTMRMYEDLFGFYDMDSGDFFDDGHYWKTTQQYGVGFNGFFYRLNDE